MQSPLCSSFNKENELSLDGSIMLVSSRSSGTSLTMTVKRECGGADTLLMPTALRHVSLGRDNSAQGLGGLCYFPPYERGHGRQTEGRAPSGASLADGSYQDKNGSYKDKSAAGSEVKKHLGEQCNARGNRGFYQVGIRIMISRQIILTQQMAPRLAQTDISTMPLHILCVRGTAVPKVPEVRGKGRGWSIPMEREALA